MANPAVPPEPPLVPSPPEPPPVPPPPVSSDPRRAHEQYRAALDGLRAGVVDIEGSPSYLMLTGGPLHGETDRQCRQAAAGAGALWPLVRSIDDGLDAFSAADEMGSKLDDLRQLIGGRRLQVDDGPLAGRSLSVGEAMSELRTAYDAIRAAVAAVDRVWLDLLPRIEAARGSLDRLRTEADALGVTEPLISRAERIADDLEARLVSDPLGITDDEGPALDGHVAAAAAQMSSLRAGHDGLDADQAGAEELLAALRVLRARAAANRAASEAKILDPQGMIHPPSAAVIDGAGGLASRLDDVLAGPAAWTQRRALLDRWLASAGTLLDQLERAAAANDRPLRVRDELRGRFTAYQAKMAAVGKAEDAHLLALSDEARAELYTAPTDLVAAESIITTMADELRA